MTEDREVSVFLSHDACRAVVKLACRKYQVNEAPLDGARKVTPQLWEVMIRESILVDICRRKRPHEDISAFILRTANLLLAERWTL